MWNFDKPQLRVGGLSVARRERICRESRSERLKHPGAPERPGKPASAAAEIWQYIPGIYLSYTTLEQTCFLRNDEMPPAKVLIWLVLSCGIFVLAVIKQ
jgi:hypothetical protein